MLLCKGHANSSASPLRVYVVSLLLWHPIPVLHKEMRCLRLQHLAMKPNALPRLRCFMRCKNCHSGLLKVSTFKCTAWRSVGVSSPISSAHLAMGQNPNTPSEHPNPTTKVGSKMGGAPLASTTTAISSSKTARKMGLEGRQASFGLEKADAEEHPGDRVQVAVVGVHEPVRLCKSLQVLGEAHAHHWCSHELHPTKQPRETINKCCSSNVALHFWVTFLL